MIALSGIVCDRSIRNAGDELTKATMDGDSRIVEFLANSFPAESWTGRLEAAGAIFVGLLAQEMVFASKSDVVLQVRRKALIGSERYASL